MLNNELLLSFYGDDFTGSTDAMESLAKRGVRTVLFTEPPGVEQLRKFDRLQAFGVAGMTRSLSPQAMEEVLRPALVSLRDSGAAIVHYKVCSTFDSSPVVGSIGRVIDLGLEIFQREIVPVLAAAPALGRYSAFGNLFARCGGESEPFRLDRHPSMSRHPVTPMDEADLSIHLSKQTKAKVGLLDVLALELGEVELQRRYEELIERGAKVALIDAIYENHLDRIGSLLAGQADRRRPLFVVGSSGVESALCGHWKCGAAEFARVQHSGPILVVCGSCSPVTGGQIRRAVENGFAEVVLDVQALSELTIRDGVLGAVKALREGRSVVIHTAGDRCDGSHVRSMIGAALGKSARKILEQTSVRRMVVAGGDTSSLVARELGIVSVEMIGELTRGSPLCKAAAPGSPADKLEITFKGGQIGNRDFFGLVERGMSEAA